MNTELQHDSDFNKAPGLSQALSAQEVFEQNMREVLPVFVEVQEKALQMALTDLHSRHPNFQNRNSKSNRVNENIRGLLFGMFPEDMRETESRRFYFYKKDQYVVLFKKLNNKLMPMNITTKNSKRILSQLSLEFPNEIPVIFIGYVIDKSWNEIKQQRAVYICNGKIVWVTDLYRFDKGLTSLNLFSNTPDDDAPLIVQPKRKKPDNEQAFSDDVPIE